MIVCIISVIIITDIIILFNKEAQTNDTCIGLKYAENLKCCSIQDITPDYLRFKPEIQEKKLYMWMHQWHQMETTEICKHKELVYDA